MNKVLFLVFLDGYVSNHNLDLLRTTAAAPPHCAIGCNFF